MPLPLPVFRSVATAGSLAELVSFSILACRGRAGSWLLCDIIIIFYYIPVSSETVAFSLFCTELLVTLYIDADCWCGCCNCEVACYDCASCCGMQLKAARFFGTGIDHVDSLQGLLVLAWFSGCAAGFFASYWPDFGSPMATDRVSLPVAASFIFILKLIFPLKLAVRDASSDSNLN